MASSSIETTSTTGPPFLAILANWGLLGVISCQVCLYSQAFPHDRWALRCLVYGVYALDIIQTCLLTDTAWKIFVNGFGNYENMDSLGTAWLSVGLIGGLVEFLVRLFYVHRITVIAENKIVTGAILLVSILSFLGAIVNTAFSIRAAHFSILLAHNSPTFIAMGFYLASGSICDIMILVCMRYYLRNRAQGVRVQATRAVVSRTIRLTIEAGALTAVTSIISLILFYFPIPSVSKYYTIPLACLAKLYSTSMLAVLNSRMKLGIISGSDITWQENGQQIPLSIIQFNAGTTRATVTSSINSSQDNAHEQREGMETIYNNKDEHV